MFIAYGSSKGTKCLHAFNIVTKKEKGKKKVVVESLTPFAWKQHEQVWVYI